MAIPLTTLATLSHPTADPPVARRPMLARAEVEKLRRQQLLDHICAVVCREGKVDLPIQAFVTEAKIARNTFYALFADRAGCYEFACEQLHARFFGGLGEACEGIAQPAKRLQMAITALLAAVAADRTGAFVYFRYSAAMCSNPENSALITGTQSLARAVAADKADAGDELIAATVVGALAVKLGPDPDTPDLRQLGNELTAMLATAAGR